MNFGPARRVCAFTGSRAEYGLLRPVLEELVRQPRVALSLLVSGSHLDPRFGMTVHEIEADGFTIAARAPILSDDFTPVGVTDAFGLATSDYGKCFARYAPDLLLILGDRFEALAAATAASIHRVPIAHISGGEITGGAIDDVFRHAITKMSHLHFTSAELYTRRVIQMGENPSRVFTAGSLGAEIVSTTPAPPREELEQYLGVRLPEKFFLVTFHTATLDIESPLDQIGELFAALDRFRNRGLGTVFTYANSDAFGEKVNIAIQSYVARNPGTALGFASLGQRRYLGMMRLCAAVVGNSSSGIMEATVIPVPTVNIGSRQDGRERQPTVIDCPPRRDDIAAALDKALAMDLQATKRTWQCPPPEGTALFIARTLAEYPLKGILRKGFQSVTF